MTPGSAVRHASVARHVTDCATRPGSFVIMRCVIKGMHCTYYICAIYYGRSLDFLLLSPFISGKVVQA